MPNTTSATNSSPKGVVAYVRSRCGESGERLVDGLVAIAFGTEQEILTVFNCKVPFVISTKDRHAAILELFDRGWGKSPQAIEHSGKIELVWQD